MIQVIPSIAIRNGKVVKMRKGDPSSEKAYDENPLDLSKRFEDHGIEVIHLVDLDGAEKGSPRNFHVLEAISNHTDLKIDFTGGISTDGDITSAYEHGAEYITASSIAVTNPELFASWIVSFGREKITLSADVTDVKTKQVAFRGWQKKSDLTLFDHLRFFYERGLKYAKCTDISHDGTMEGPDLSFYQEILRTFPDLKVLASGGVRNADDIRQLNDLGIFAVIFGKSFYEGQLALTDLESFLVKS
jgi:phosphoribosylformimino-5-aminoimidazole carboxamide ribotide isomerase